MALVYDLSNPYYGKADTGVDLWIGYRRELTNGIHWRVQLNVRNVGKGDSIVPVSTQWDGTPAQWVTNTIEF